MKINRLSRHLPLLLLLTASLLCETLLAEPSAALDKEPSAGLDKEPEEAKWDVNNPPGNKFSIDLDIDQGTWMSLDVSPDGKTIAFDLLGDIYTLPMEGGEATNISSGLAWEFQPRFSPDGTRIAFTSDRAGGENIWLMNADGSDAQALTEETFRLLNNPSWHPSGQYILARKHFTTTRSLGTGEIWQYHIDGGEGIALIKKPDDKHQKELGEPIYSPDGNLIYYSLDVTPGGTFRYAQDSNGELFQIRAFNPETGETETVVSGPGGAVRPTPSPDGRYLAFVRRVRARSALFLMDLTSGAIKLVYEDLDQDVQEVWATQGVYPNMDWTSNSAHLVFWAGGKIRKLNMQSNKVQTIPFHVKDQREVLESPLPTVAVYRDKFNTQMPKSARINATGSRVVFESLGKLWIKSLPNGEPSRLLGRKLPGFESQPSWSADGKFILFVHWQDDKLGDIYRVKANGGGLRKLSKDPGHYANPRFSADGKHIVFSRDAGGYLTSDKWSRHPGIYTMDSRGGKTSLVSKHGNNAQFGPLGQRIYMSLREAGKTYFISTNLDGSKQRRHAVSSYASNYTLSPDARHLVFQENYNLHLIPLPITDQALELSPKMKSLPIVRISRDGGDFPNWLDKKTISWSAGPLLYSADLETLKNKKTKHELSALANLSMSITADKPEGLIAFTNVRIVTMSDINGGIIENGSILIRDNRIEAVGRDIEIPREAKQLDLAGKTITPGFIDAHAHGPHGAGNIIPQRNWASHATLALGVTTTHNPSSNSQQIFPAAEMQKAGLILAPRTFSTGEIIYGAKSTHFASIESYDDAASHVRRLKSHGAISVKNYNQPRRDQRQQVASAARAENIRVVAEGGALFHMDMSLIADGQTTLEHNLPQWAIYDDVVQFWSQTRVGYTPTFVVSYNGPSAERYWYQETDVWRHPILSLHVPPHILQPASVRREKAPTSDYAHIASAKIAKKLADKGVSVHIGAHGQREGLAAHWEMWSLAQGGMSPVEVLNAATLQAAKHLGMAAEIGSIEVGKLADLVIHNSDVSQDIFHSDEIDMVMLNGRLYDAKTLNETLSGDWSNPSYYWN